MGIGRAVHAGTTAVLAVSGIADKRARMSLLAAQVSGGEVEIVNVRETDPTLGPLVATLIGLGAAALVGTVLFWFLTRPTRSTVRRDGETNG